MSTDNRASIALIELTGGQNLHAALAHLKRAETGMEILVLCRDAAPDLPQTQGLRILEKTGKTIPERRLAAIRAAHTEWIVLLEDTTLPNANWFATMPNPLVDQKAGGFWGPVHLGPDLPARFKALGAMEYGRFFNPAPAEDTMPGNCMILRRDETLATIDPTDTGIVEHVLVPYLSSRSRPVRFNPDLSCTYAQQDPYGARLSTRFSHGRLYAANRYDPKDRQAHFKSAVRAVLVPLVLSLRGMRHLVAQSRGIPSPFALLWIALMSVAWGAGEVTGHLAGEGQSKESWS